MPTERHHEQQSHRLRQQRNIFVAMAVLSLAISIGFALPPRLREYREAKKVTAELLTLQGTIVTTQKELRTVQAEILKVQDEIKTLQTR